MTPSQEDGVWDLETPEERSERVAVGGRRRAGTGVYVQVHEDSEHRRTPSGARAVAFGRFPVVLQPDTCGSAFLWRFAARRRAQSMAVALDKRGNAAA